MMEVEYAGFFSSIQDRGRPGYRKWGVPLSGAMDMSSAGLANRLLGNKEQEAVLELSLEGPRLRFLQPAYFCLTGARLNARLEAQELEMNTPYLAREGDLLNMGHCLEGVRSYLGIQGGIQTETVLGSRSYYFPVTPEARIQKGDLIPIAPSPKFEPSVWAVKWAGIHKQQALEVLPGPEWMPLPSGIRESLLKQTFHIAKENNRMACQLEERLAPNEISVLTSVTLPGTVQLTPSGRLIILMRDAQTTGGYPRVLQLTESSIDALAQRSTGDAVRFALRQN